VLPISHDEVVHGKRLADQQRCRATSGSSSPTCARSWRTCGASRQEAAVHGAGNRPARGVEPQYRMRWELLEFEPHRKLQALVRELNRSTAPTRRCIRWTFTTAASSGWTFTIRRTPSSLPAARRGSQDFSCCSAATFTPVPRKLRNRRARRGLLRGDSEYRFGAVRRQQPGQRRAGIYAAGSQARCAISTVPRSRWAPRSPWPPCRSTCIRPRWAERAHGRGSRCGSSPAARRIRFC
jgi:hypothetical protein